MGELPSGFSMDNSGETPREPSYREHFSLPERPAFYYTGQLGKAHKEIQKAANEGGLAFEDWLSRRVGNGLMNDRGYKEAMMDQVEEPVGSEEHQEWVRQKRAARAGQAALEAKLFDSQNAAEELGTDDFCV